MLGYKVRSGIKKKKRVKSITTQTILKNIKQSPKCFFFLGSLVVLFRLVLLGTKQTD